MVPLSPRRPSGQTGLCVSEPTLPPRWFSGDKSHPPLVRPKGSHHSARGGARNPHLDAPYLVKDYSSHGGGGYSTRRSNQKCHAFKKAIVSAREKNDNPQM